MVSRLASAVKSGLDSGPPYSVWKAPKADWWTVIDCLGVNILDFGDGRVFTDEVEANRLAKEWNAKTA